MTYRYKACASGIQKQVVEMAINGSGIRDTSLVLQISKTTIINSIRKKENNLRQVNPNIPILGLGSDCEVCLELACDAAELDEQWSLVESKSNQRWLWYATNTVLVYVLAKRKDTVFKQLKAFLEPFGIQRFSTDDGGAYERNLDRNKPDVGRRNAQKIERKNLNFRAWIKCLARKTICFSKLDEVHDKVIGLLINKVEFRANIYAKTRI